MNHPIELEGEMRRQAQSTNVPQPQTYADRVVFLTLAQLGYIVISTGPYTRLIRKAAA